MRLEMGSFPVADIVFGPATRYCCARTASGRGSCAGRFTAGVGRWGRRDLSDFCREVSRARPLLHSQRELNGLQLERLPRGRHSAHVDGDCCLAGLQRSATRRDAPSIRIIKWGMGTQ